MLSIRFSERERELFGALGSEVRARILTILREREGMNVKALAQELDIPVSTLGPHLDKLSECGLVYYKNCAASHGQQKLCYTDVDQILIDFSRLKEQRAYLTEIPVGNYSDFDVKPTCGLALASSFLGALDEPRYFTHPDHYQAGILWFTTGYVEYFLPNLVLPGSRIKELTVSFEIASEAPQVRDEWPSDIEFLLNGTSLGTWTSPGDFGDRRGRLNPEWWYSFLNQYGLLKKLTIGERGTFLDGEKLSDVTTRSLGLTDQSLLRFRFSVSENAAHPNGCTLFGKEFGDYSQGIRVELKYAPIGES